jgi:hypothetical protein
MHIAHHCDECAIVNSRIDIAKLEAQGLSSGEVSERCYRHYDSSVSVLF